MNKAFWKLVRTPIRFGELVFTVLLYLLGIAVAVYSGVRIDWQNAVIGLIALLSLHVGMKFLHTHFALDADLLTRLEEIFELNKAKRAGDQLIIDRPRFLFALLSLPFFFSFLLSVMVLAQQGALSIGFGLVLFLMLALWGCLILPPLQLLSSPYRDLAAGIQWVIFYPIFGSILQRSMLPDVLFLFTLPLFLVFLSSSIALQFEQYDEELRRDSKTLLVQIGWETGMRIHNLLLLIAFVVLLLMPILFSLAWPLVWPLLIALPFAVAQLGQMIHIHNAGTPNWRLLKFSAQATCILLLYLQIFTLLTY